MQRLSSHYNLNNHCVYHASRNDSKSGPNFVLGKFSPIKLFSLSINIWRFHFIPKFSAPYSPICWIGHLLHQIFEDYLPVECAASSKQKTENELSAQNKKTLAVGRAACVGENGKRTFAALLGWAFLPKISPDKAQDRKTEYRFIKNDKTCSRSSMAPPPLDTWWKGDACSARGEPGRLPLLDPLVAPPLFIVHTSQWITGSNC